MYLIIQKWIRPLQSNLLIPQHCRQLARQPIAPQKKELWLSHRTWSRFNFYNSCLAIIIIILSSKEKRRKNSIGFNDGSLPVGVAQEELHSNCICITKNLRNSFTIIHQSLVAVCAFATTLESRVYQWIFFDFPGEIILYYALTSKSTWQKKERWIEDAFPVVNSVLWMNNNISIYQLWHILLGLSFCEGEEEIDRHPQHIYIDQWNCNWNSRWMFVFC